jgi:hypothetical protein
MIQIIDGFQVNVARPIDSRMVTTGTASRNAIAYKYAGLRVYDTVAMQPYVWNGTSWVSENASTVTITGTTTAGYIPKFGASSQITNSIIQEVANGIKILAGSGTQPTFKLEVTGTIKATQFQGSGNGLTNIPASNITGTINPSAIANPTPVAGQVFVLAGGSSNPVWTNLKSIPSSALPGAPVSLDITTGPGNSVTTELFPLFAKSIGGTYSYYRTTGGDALKFVPRVGTTEGAQLLVPNGSEANPGLGFSTNVNTGIYRAAFNQLGISTNSKERVRITDQGVLVKSTLIADATMKVLNSGGRPFLGFYGTNGDSRLSATIGFPGLWYGGAPLYDFIIENLAGQAARTYPLANGHFDAGQPAATSRERHAINLNVYGQTIISTNVGSKLITFNNAGVANSPSNSNFPNGAYGCEIKNVNTSLGHGLIVRSGGGPSTVSARFDNGNKTIAYFTDRGLQIMSGSVDAPSICFDSDKASQGLNTGLYLESTKTIGIVAGSKRVLTISDTEIRLPKVYGLAYIFGDNTRIEGTNRTNSLEIYRPTTNGGFAICHFYSDIGGVKAAKAYIWPDGTYYRLSDRRQKENIEDISYGLDSISRLRPVSHTWIGSTNSKKSLGFIAQEVEEVIDEVVNTSMDGDREIKALDYNGLIPVLIKAVQELSEKVKILENR